MNERELYKLYKQYCAEWKETHKGKEYKGMYPASFDEWLDNEYEEYIDGDDNFMSSSTNGDYSPSNPWGASGMSVKDFIR